MGGRRGFTLMEMMVVMSIFTLVTGIAYTALRLNDNYRDMILVKNDLYRNCKRSMDAIGKELEKSRSQGLTPHNNDPNPDSIYFQIPLINSAVSPNYNVQWGARYAGTDYPNRFVRYRLNGTTLLRGVIDDNGTPLDDSDDTIESGTQEETIAENITDLDFVQAVDFITITLSSRKTTLTGGQRPLTMSVTSQVYLRNR